MTNVKKKDGKRFGAIVLSLILLLSLVFPYPVMADQTTCLLYTSDAADD